MRNHPRYTERVIAIKLPAFDIDLSTQWTNPSLPVASNTDYELSGTTKPMIAAQFLHNYPVEPQTLIVPSWTLPWTLIDQSDSPSTPHTRYESKPTPVIPILDVIY